MGNRAVIAFDTYTDNSTGVYLHWNGGRDSIEGFLLFAKTQHPWAKHSGREKLIAGIAAFGVSAHGVEVKPCKQLDCDNWDNGVYLVDTNTWEITGRYHKRHQEQQSYDLLEFAREVERKYCLKNGITSVDRYIAEKEQRDNFIDDHLIVVHA